VRLARVGLPALAVMMAAACRPDAVTAPAPVAEALPERALPTLPEMRLRDVLGGRALGVRVISERRAPIRIVIREGSPIPSANPPLFVLDGIPLSQGGLEAAAVNPTEIVELQILKGPAAVRIYGPSARNGAVLIRTRRR
jgi:TonB-dependent Receptor Plug Domain